MATVTSVYHAISALNNPVRAQRLQHILFNFSSEQHEHLGARKILSLLERFAKDLAKVKEHVTKLHTFDFDLKGVSLEGMAVPVAAALSSVPALNTFRLIGNLDGWKGVEGGIAAETIADALLHVQSLHVLVLHLDASSLGSSAVPIINSLRDLRELRKLDLAKNGLRDSDAVALANALPCLPHLIILNLDDNLLGASDAVALADAFPVMPALRSLQINSNKLGSAGASAIAAALHHLPSLASLKLRSNGIGDEGVAALAAALPVPVLRDFDLQLNEFGSVGKRALALAVRESPGVLTDVTFARHDERDETLAAALGGDSSGSSSEELMNGKELLVHWRRLARLKQLRRGYQQYCRGFTGAGTTFQLSSDEIGVICLYDCYI
jgi:Ran GTPase-activating protein (RanGAP) involved in mRNA processing and transport